MEFYFPLAVISPRSLAGTIAPFAGKRQRGSAQGDKAVWSLPEDFPERVANLGFARVTGFMRGAMDLVFRSEGRFYLLDWKSNYLGDGPLSYHPEALEGAMTEHHYHLQYLIYLAALHGFLRLRLPGYDYGRHFGCVFYIFLRGIDSGTGGIYRARPPVELLERLCGLMMKQT
jgi:exodeoxyribonuclease V beta subunit